MWLGQLRGYVWSDKVAINSSLKFIQHAKQALASPRKEVPQQNHTASRALDKIADRDASERMPPLASIPSLADIMEAKS